MLLQLAKPVAQIHRFTYTNICFIWLKEKKSISYDLQIQHPKKNLFKNVAHLV